MNLEISNNKNLHFIFGIKNNIKFYIKVKMFNHFFITVVRPVLKRTVHFKNVDIKFCIYNFVE